MNRDISINSEEAFINLDIDDCLALLATHEVGRLCVLDQGCPVAYPVNYRLVPSTTGNAAIAIRTRAHGILDRPSFASGFEIDGFDPLTATGWSVVLRGTLSHADAPGVPTWVRAWDPRPWLTHRDLWLYFLPTTITGRRLVAGTVEWAFSIHGYV